MCGAGCFVVEPIHVNHSIADAFALAIDTLRHGHSFRGL